MSKGNHAQPIPPKAPPPCADGSPPWLLAVRDEYAATGEFNLKVAAENLRVGEKLIAAWEEIVKVNSDTIDIGTTLPHDDTRVWCVVPAGKVAP